MWEWPLSLPCSLCSVPSYHLAGGQTGQGGQSAGMWQEDEGKLYQLDELLYKSEFFRNVPTMNVGLLCHGAFLT